MKRNASHSENDDRRWQAVLARDRACDGTFVYAVTSTGIFCRPSCPSRRPRRDRTVFFFTSESAKDAGFRACRRCRPEDAPVADSRISLAQRVAARIDRATESPPTLAQLSSAVGVSPFHLQRTFKEVMGITPRQYAEARRLDRLKRALGAGEGVAPALYGAGYGSSSRLYEKAPSHLGMTPASYAKGGRGARIVYSITASVLGRFLVATTEKGICAVSLGDADDILIAGLRRDFPAAHISADRGGMATRVAKALASFDGHRPHGDLPLDLRATAFHWGVWEELRKIPAGETRSYGQLAKALGKPAAARAVGRACAANPVALIVPCHRVVGGDGGLTGYRWGMARKKKLLERERSFRGSTDSQKG